MTGLHAKLHIPCNRDKQNRTHAKRDRILFLAE